MSDIEPTQILNLDIIQNVINKNSYNIPKKELDIILNILSTLSKNTQNMKKLNEIFHILSII